MAISASNTVIDELIQNSLDMAVEEGGLAAGRAAGSPFISSTGSIACAVFTRNGQQIAQTAGGLLHVSALRVMLHEILAAVPLDRIEEGDMFILNDHFLGGIHPTDVGMFRPVFADGRLVLFTASMMIVSDLGGMSSGGLPANATEIFHEGLVIPVLRYQRRGAVNEDVRDLIRANSRTPEKVIGDLDALVAGVNVSAARSLEVVERYGAEVTLDVARRLIDYAENMARAGIADMPDGRYEGSCDVEGDGIDDREKFTVRCAITIDGSDCVIDFAGTDAQAQGPVNASYSQALSGAVYAMRCYLDPYIPMNDGFYRVVDVRLPKGTLVNPNYPAACNLRMGIVTAMVGAINRAFAETFPDRVVAGSSAAITATVSSIVPGPEGPWAMMDAHFGVGGARQGADGVDGTPTPIYASSGWERSIESYELEYPIDYEDFRFLPDSGGPGQWRGGTGVIKHILFHEDGWLTVRGSDGFAFGPFGLMGGAPGSTAKWVVNEGTDREQELPPKKTNHRIRAGDRLTFINAGGGGFGDPLQRSPEAVAKDVADGLVTIAGALDDYGVTIAGNGSGHRRAAS